MTHEILFDSVRILIYFQCKLTFDIILGPVCPFAAHVSAYPGMVLRYHDITEGAGADPHSNSDRFPTPK